MIRWCAYCQTYQGESAPFDDFAYTHTICDACFARGAFRDLDPMAGIERIRDLFERLANRPREASPRALLAEGEALGLSPVDLLVGVMQPVLYEVGARWARGEARVADEHAISRTCSVAIDLLLAGRPDLADKRQVTRPDVLLACAPDNFHGVGLQLVEFYLLDAGFSVYVVIPGLPADEIVELARDLEPKLVGLSAATSEQLASVCAIADRIAALPIASRPLVVLGGTATRGDVAPSPCERARLCQDFRSIPSLLAESSRTGG